MSMENWRNAWRNGFFPSLSTPGLMALQEALQTDDDRLTQGSTTTPPPSVCVQDWDVEAACALGFCAWQGDGLGTVGEVEEYFARACFEADQRLGEPGRGECVWFLDAYDDWSRQEMLSNLLPEVILALDQRRQQEKESCEQSSSVAVTQRPLTTPISSESLSMDGAF